MPALPALRAWPSPIHVLLADKPGFGRTALADALAATPGVELVATIDDGPALRDALARFRPDVLVIDDRLVGHGLRLPPAARPRVIVIGVDDDPGYAARASRSGAVAWVPKDRVDLLLGAILESAGGAEKYVAARRWSADDRRQDGA